MDTKKPDKRNLLGDANTYLYKPCQLGSDAWRNWYLALTQCSAFNSRQRTPPIAENLSHRSKTSVPLLITLFIFLMAAVTNLRFTRAINFILENHVVRTVLVKIIFQQALYFRLLLDSAQITPSFLIDA